MHPHMLRHTFVTTMRDVQIAARHADPRTNMRYDRARKNLDREDAHSIGTLFRVGGAVGVRRRVG